MRRDRPPPTTAHQLTTATLAVAATARVIRLITRDDFPFRPVRDWLLTRYGPHAWITRLIECPWCVGVWAAAPATLTAARWGHTRWWRALAAWMGLSMAASTIVVLTTHPDPAPEPDPEPESSP